MDGIPEDAVAWEQTLMQVYCPEHPHKLLHQLIFGFPDGRDRRDTVMGRRQWSTLCDQHELLYQRSSVSTDGRDRRMPSMG